MFYLFLLVVGVLGIGIYVLFIFSQVPGAAEERLGVLEPLPSDLGNWLSDESSAEAVQARERGQKREVRTLYEERGGLFAGGRFVRQVRYRNLTTNAIERVEPDEVIKRRRIKPS
jgi:hypothetical protein